MDTSVQLQSMFSYSMTPLVIAESILLLIAMVMIFYFVTHKKKPKVKKEVVSPVQQPVRPVAAISVRDRYLEKIAQVELGYKNGEYTAKKCFEKLSGIVRSFVEQVTGIPVTTATLLDIQKEDLPMLEQLISGYYHPEFASELDETTSEAEQVGEAVTNAKKVIETWN